MACVQSQSTMGKGSLIFVGMGLHDELGISLRGLEALKDCEHAFAELYTSKMPGLSIERLSERCGKTIRVLRRVDVEEKADEIVLERAAESRVVLLVPGDPMTATTHVDLRLRAYKRGISTGVIHAASIMSAVAGATGLQSYKFGRTVTLPFAEKVEVAPSTKSFILTNMRAGLHTLVLLEVAQAKFVSASDAAAALLEGGAIEDRDLLVAVVRVESSDMVVKARSAEQLARIDFGGPPHALVIPSDLHFVEAEALRAFADAPPKNLA